MPFFTSSESTSTGTRAACRRLAGSSSAALIAAAALAASAAASSPVTVSPAAGDPSTVFHVQVPATFPIRQFQDRYYFVLRGPGGRQCDGSVTDRVGITPPKRAKTVAVDMPGVRVVNSHQIVPGPWCTGTFSGHVEFRDWRPRTRRYVVHRIGSFTVQVQ
jgi:hypothetical protein